MKKHGFTIAEILVAIAVIGIVAAISSPILSNVIPDRDKLLMLKAYKNLNEVTQEMLNDPGLYLSDGNCEGLDCRAQAMALEDEKYQGYGKYPHLLARGFNGDDATVTKINDYKYKFEAADKSIWYVEKEMSNYIVTVDVNGDEGKNSAYSSSVKTPDQYKFNVLRNGNIRPHDALTEAYLLTKSNLKNRKQDLEKASNLYETKWKNYGLYTLIPTG